MILIVRHVVNLLMSEKVLEASHTSTRGMGHVYRQLVAVIYEVGTDFEIPRNNAIPLCAR